MHIISQARATLWRYRRLVSLKIPVCNYPRLTLDRGLRRGSGVGYMVYNYQRRRISFVVSIKTKHTSPYHSTHPKTVSGTVGIVYRRPGKQPPAYRNSLLCHALAFAQR